MNGPEDRVSYETITLEKIKVQLAQEFHPHFFEMTKVTAKETMRGLMIKLHHEVFGQHRYQKYTVSIEVPASWWDHFKQDKMPKWFLKLSPVKMKSKSQTVTFDHKKIFPDSTIRYPDGLGPVYYHSNPMDPDVF